MSFNLDINYILSLKDFYELKEYVISFTGLNYFIDKDDELAKKVVGRMKLLNIDNISNYSSLLKKSSSGEKEIEFLINELTVGETYFFRERPSFEAIKNLILPQIFKRNANNKSLRIWCAGCSTGEEVYSLSILINRDFRYYSHDWDIYILGTDINQKFLEKAKAGKYSSWSLRNTSDEIKEMCFSDHGKYLTIIPRYRSNTHFEWHNLVKTPFPSTAYNICDFDLILCRNVMIYFNQKINQELISKFRQSLAEDGWLIIGHTEHNIKYFKDFYSINTFGTCVYSKSSMSEYETGVPFTQFSQSSLFSDDKDEDNQTNKNTFKDLNSELTNTSLTEHNIHNNLLYKSDQSNNEVETTGSQSHGTQSNEKLNLSSEHHINLDNQNSEPDILDIKKLLKDKKYEEARILCENLFSNENIDPELYFYYGFILKNTNKYEEAEIYLRKSIELNYYNILSHFFLGCVLRSLKKYKAAEEKFNYVLSILSSTNQNLLDNYLSFDIKIIKDETAQNLKEISQLIILQSE